MIINKFVKALCAFCAVFSVEAAQDFKEKPLINLEMEEKKKWIQAVFDRAAADYGGERTAFFGAFGNRLVELSGVSLGGKLGFRRGMVPQRVETSCREISLVKGWPGRSLGCAKSSLKLRVIVGSSRFA